MEITGSEMPKKFKPKELLCVCIRCAVGIYYRLPKSILDFVPVKSNKPPARLGIC